MLHQSTANVHPFLSTLPAAPWEAPDPLPVMRREMKLLLIELNLLRTEVQQLRSGRNERLPHGLGQPDHGEPRPLAAGSGAPQRVDGAGAALVTPVVALSPRLQGLAQGDRPDLAPRPRGIE